MTKQPVTPARIAIAARTLANADVAAVACREAGLPYFAAAALLEKESGGRNIWGGDHGSVTEDLHGKEIRGGDFVRFLVEVMNGGVSNGVGPCQITYAGDLHNGHRDGGYFRQMLEQGLRPWVPLDNCRFGFTILAGNYANTGNWTDAFARYNGGPHPNEDAQAYGVDGNDKLKAWKRAFGIK